MSQLDLFADAIEAPVAAKPVAPSGVLGQILTTAREQSAPHIRYGFQRLRFGGIKDLIEDDGERDLYETYPATWYIHCHMNLRDAACASLNKGYIERTGEAA